LEARAGVAADARGVSRKIFARTGARAAGFAGEKDGFFALRGGSAGTCGSSHRFGLVMGFMLVLSGELMSFVVSGVGFRFG